MASLLNWLGGAAAQINPFDNGETFDSYQKKRQKEAQVNQQNIQRQKTEVGKFNQMDVYQQRSRLSELNNLANRTNLSTQADVSNRNWARQQVADIEKNGVKKGGNLITFAQDMAKDVTDPYNRILTGWAEVANEVTGGAQRERDVRARQDAQDVQLIKTYGNLIKNGTPEQQVRARQGLAKLGQTINVQNEAQQARNDQVIERTDPVKAAGALGSIGLDIATAGFGGQLLKGGVKVGTQGLKQATGNRLIDFANAVVNPQTVKQGLVGGAGLGAGYGATGTAEQYGASASPLDYARGIATGAVTGGALGAGGAAVGRIGQIARNNFGMEPSIQRQLNVENNANVYAQQMAQSAVQQDKRIINASNLIENNNVKINELLARGFSLQSPDIRKLQNDNLRAEKFISDLGSKLLEAQQKSNLKQATKQAKSEQRKQMLTNLGEDIRGLNNELRELVPGGTLDSPLGYRKADKDLKKAIDTRIYESNPELFHNEATGQSFSDGGGNIPRLHVDDIKHYFGHTEDLPATYKRTTGERDIDKLAQQAGYDDVDTFVESIQRELDTRSVGRDNQRKLQELRNDPKVIEQARKALDDDKAQYGTPERFEPSARDMREYDKMNRTSEESTVRRVERALDPNDTLQYKNLNPVEKKLYQGEKAKAKLASRVSVSSSQAGGNPNSRSLVQSEPKSVAPQPNPRPDVPSSLKTGEISTSPKSKLQPETAPAAQGTDTKALTTKDRSYVDNTTSEVKKRGFVTSVKGSDEVSTQTKRKVSGEYNVRSTASLAQNADEFAKGDIQQARADVNSRLDVKNGKITDQDVADSMAVAKRLDSEGQFDQSQAIYDKLAEHGTASGQTIQAFSLLKNRTPEGIKYQMLRDLKKNGVNLTDADQKKVGQLIDNVRKTKPNSEARNRALFETMDYVAKRIPNNRGDKIVNFWRASLLTAPKTTGGNILGNASEMASRELWANPVAIATDKFFSMFTGKRTKTFGRGTVGGMKEGAVKGWDYMKTGYDPRNINNKWDAPRRVNYKNKLVDGYVNGVYRWMGTQDQPFYYGAKAAAAHDLAKADGLNLGYKGEQLAKYVEESVANGDWKPQTFKTAKDVEKYARYAVYQNETLLGNMATSIKQAADRKGMRWLTDFILPFTQVPSSIAMRVIDRTPIGTAREIVSQIRKKSFDQRAMAEAIGNGSFGIPVVAAGYALSQAGEITGDYPTDSKERALWEEEGKQPYSIRIGDKWHSLNYLQPFGTILNIGHKIDEQRKAGISESEAWLNAVTSAGQSVTDQSFLKGLNGVLSALNDPDRSLEQFAKQSAGSAIPNFIRSFAGAIDDKQRDMKGTDIIDSMVKSAQSGIPGIRQGLPEKQGMFGNTLERRDDAVNSYLNPLRPSKVKNENDPLLKELRRLQDGGNGIVTTEFSKSSIKDVELNDQQIRDLNKQVNSRVQTEWNNAIKDSRYAGLSDEDKNTVLKRIKDNVGKAVKGEFVSQNNLQTTGEYKASSSNPFNVSEGGSSATYAEKYTNAQTDWDKNSKSWSSVKRTEKQKELRKLKVQKDYDNDTVDLYGWSKTNIADWLSTEEKGVDKQKIADQLHKYDRALYDAGLIDKMKFRNGFGSGGRSGSKSTGVTQAKAKVALQSEVNKIRAPKTTTGQSLSSGKGSSYKKAALKQYAVKKVGVTGTPLKITSRKAKV